MDQFSTQPDVSGPATDTPTVLLADPTSDDIDDLSCWLAKRGYRVVAAETLEDAQARIRELKPSFVVCELKFPDGDGFTLLEYAKAQKIETRLVVHSRFTNVSVAVAATKLGATDVLPKPSTAGMIQAILLGSEDAESAISRSVPHPNDICDEHIRRTLAATGGNVTASARMLSMHRRSLQRYIHRRSLFEKAAQR